MRWTEDELLLTLHLYERIPFGQQDARNPQVVALAERLGRTPGSVAMKLNNVTSLDASTFGCKGAAKRAGPASRCEAARKSTTRIP